MSEIILLIVLILVYLLIGTFLAGVFGPDDDDTIDDALCTVFWPAMIVIFAIFGIGFGLTKLTDKPFYFIKGLGQKLGEKLEGTFDKKKKKEKSKTKEHHIEHDTRCDKCDRLQECLKDDILLDVTKMSDSRKHYIRGMGAECKVDAELHERILKELECPTGDFPISEELRESYEKWKEMMGYE